MFQSKLNSSTDTCYSVTIINMRNMINELLMGTVVMPLSHVILMRA